MGYEQNVNVFFIFSQKHLRTSFFLNWKLIIFTVLFIFFLFFVSNVNKVQREKLNFKYLQFYFFVNIRFEDLVHVNSMGKC
jgi:hypothetical protein